MPRELFISIGFSVVKVTLQKSICLKIKIKIKQTDNSYRVFSCYQAKTNYYILPIHSLCFVTLTV